MKAILTTLLLTTLLYSPLSWGLTERVLELSADQKVYFRYAKAKKGQPTVVLLNGLIYAISNWDGYVEALTDKGVGVVQVAYSTQPESLAQLDEGVSPYYSDLELFWGVFKQVGLETQTLVDEVMAVVNQLEVDNFTLVSLSYGSIPASELALQNKERIDNFILMAPAVKTTGRYNDWGKGRHAWYTTLLLSGNLLADYAYDQELKATLSLLINPMQYQFENVEFQDFFNGAYQMARSSKWFDLHDYADTTLPDTYLFVATLEDAPLYRDQLLFWDKMQGNPAQKSLVTFEGAYHAIPGVAPKKAAAQTLKVLKGKMKKAEISVKVSEEKPFSSDKKNSLFSSDRWSEASR